MDNHSGTSHHERMSSRRDKHGGPKEYRISKADIGGPVIKEAKLPSEKMEQRGTVMLRCVVIKKDEKGFGLTVSGDNPVYVQSVKENGAAMMAGVLQGDRIYKVNGINVIESNHIEVVKLIKAENHVTLMLLSPNAASEETSGPMQELPPLPVTRPISAAVSDPLHDVKVETIKKMLESEKEEVERIKEEYARNPDKKLLEDLAGAQKLQQDLEKQLWKVESSRQLKLANIPPSNHVTGSVSIDETELFYNEEQGYLEKTRDTTRPTKPIINFEDEELAEESSPQNHGPFLDFNQLKTKHAHAAVFLNYVFHSHDPSHLLLVLMTEIYRQTSTTKELYKLADVIIKTYLMDNAPLKVPLDEGIAKSTVDNCQSRSLSDDALRSLFDPVAQHALKTVKSQLEQYCSTRDKGLSNCYGEDKVMFPLADGQVVKVVEDIVSPLLHDLAQLQTGADESESQKTSAKTDALERLLTYWTGKKKSKITSRIGSMLRPNRPAYTARPWSSASVESILDDPKQRHSIGKLRMMKRPKSSKDPVGDISNDAGNAGLHKSHDSLNAASDNEDKHAGSKDLRSEKSIRRNTDGEFDNADNDSRAESETVEMTPEAILKELYRTHPEFDIAPESSWTANAPRQIVKHLDKKEGKRQEIINELLQTEQHHVRDLQILSVLFYKRMKEEGGLQPEELAIVFPNLHEILDMHQKLKDGFIGLKKNDGYVIKAVGPVLREMFLDASGEKFQQACATYCGNQSAALVFIKERCRKDQKFNAVIQAIEKHPVCRRLQLKDFIPGEFQRLTKYPLLIENIMKNTKKNEEPVLPEVLKKSKEILKFVDKAIKDAEDFQKVVEIQKNLDASALAKVQHPIALEYKNINLTKRKLIHQGPLSWRVTINEKKKSIGLHCVLFEDIMVLLQKQEDRYVLKCHTNTSAPKDSGKVTTRVQPPILKLSKVIVRIVATDKRAFYVLSASEFGAQIYDLVASTAHEMKEWVDLVEDAIKIAKTKDNTTVMTPVGKSSFLLPETTPGHQKTPALALREAENDADAADAKAESPAESDIVAALRTQDHIINTALTEKHRLLAAHIGMDPNDLESVLEMSVDDPFPDLAGLVTHLITMSNNLASMMSDALQPDTEFLPPTSPLLLKPVSEAISMPGPPVEATADNSADAQSDRNDEDTNAVPAAISELPKSDQNADISAENASDEDAADDDTEGKDAGLEVNVNSDYETASESASPPGGQSEENDDEPDREEVSTQDDVSSPVTEGAESGIATDSNDAKTVSETDLTSDLLSPMQSDANDLLDFGTDVVMPEEGSLTTLAPDEYKSSLYAKTNPINVTKMLKTQRSMHSQLLRLLEVLKSDERADRVSDDNERLTADANTLPHSRTGSRTALNDALDRQDTPPPRYSVAVNNEDDIASPSIPKK